MHNREWQARYAEHVMKERQAVYEGELAGLTTLKELDIISANEYDRRKRALDRRHSGRNATLPQLLDPKYWQRLPFSGAERKGYTAWEAKERYGLDVSAGENTNKVSA